MLLLLLNYDSLSQQNVAYTPLFTNSTFTKTINVNLPIGTTGGAANVANGSGSYSIPITVPTGTNDVTPSLSLNYNSLGGNGPIGVGWSLSGFSMISRTNKDIYRDGAAGAVDLSVNDRFVIDGERLITKTGTYGGDLATYGKEPEDFSTTTSYGNFGGGPQYFKVETKEGIVFEFGNTVDSRFLNSDNTKVLYWRLNRVIYKDGNYIDYKYTTINNEMLIDEINYTGNINTGLAPYNKVKFNYLVRNDKNTTYEVGKAIQSNLLLSSIVVTTESSVSFKSYNLNYGHDNISSYLKEIQEVGSDGLGLNSTIFKYGDEPTGFETGSSSVVAGQTVDLFSGDFDGDGYSDMLAADYAYYNGGGTTIKYHTGFKIFKRTSTSTSYSLAYTETFPTGTLFQIVNEINTPKNLNFIASDFTGDGRDDIMINKLGYTSTGGFKVEYFKLYTSTSTGNSTCTFNTSQNLPYTQSSGCSGTYDRFPAHLGDGQYFFPGDYNSDGATDYLTILSSGNGFRVFISFPALGLFNKEVTNILSGCSVNGLWVHTDMHNVIDFDGDGKSDLMLTKGSETKIFSFSPSGSNWAATEKYSAGYPTKWHLLYFTDFNGDGKTDILARTSTTNNNNPWSKATNTGTGFIETPFTFQHTPNITGQYSDDKLVFADFNSDGKQDIYHGWNYFVGGSASTSKLDMYYSKGNDFYFTQHSYSALLGFVPNIPVDLNGDGRPEIINRNYYLDPFTILYFKKEGQERLLQKIKNGVDHDVEFVYKRMTQTSNFFIKGASTSSPINNLQAPMYLVSQFKSENGIGGFSTTDFQYEEAKIHKEGKGFLGFKKVTSIDNVSGYKTIQENEFNTTFYTTMPLKTSKYLNSTSALLNEVTNTNQFINLGSKRFWPRVNATYENKQFEGQFISKSYTYDTYGNPTTVTSNINNIETKTTTTIFGTFGTPIPAKPTSITESITRTGQVAYSLTTTYGYNAIGQLTSKVDFSGLPKSVSYSYVYNNLGNQISATTTPSGMTARTNSQTFDAKGRFIVSLTNVLNQTSTITNDVKWAKPTLAIGIDGIQMTYTYDAFGRILSAYDPQRGVTVTTSYGWDINASDGTVHFKLVSHPGKPNEKVWYDVLDREKRKDIEIFGNTWATQKNTYDSRGNIATSTLPYKTGETILTTTNSYDTYNRISSSVNTIGTTSYAYSFAAGILNISITNPASQVKSTKTDATGKMVSATDYGGTLDYTYFSHGKVKDVKMGTTVLTSNEYDAYARQTKLIDINAGTTQYTTDALGQMLTMINATGQTNNFSYDILGRKTYHGRTEGSSSFTYYPTGSGGATNRLNTISNYGGISESYVYDAYGRITTKNETVDGINHQSTFTYNIYDDVASQTYPSGLLINYAYDANGYLSTIKNANNTTTIYSNTSTNGLNQTTAYSLGNGKASSIAYYFGTVNNYTTTGIQNLTLNWNYQSGNLTSRVDAIKSKTESFTYDNLNRLLTASGTGLTTLSSNYASNGNINSKTDAGTYSYTNAKINAVTQVTNPSNVIPSNVQDIVYSSFYQPLTISEGINHLTYTYSYDDQRIKSVLKQNNIIVNTKYYFGDYEKDITSSTTRHLHYISAPAGLVCIIERIGTSDTYHYTYTDHLGSILTVTTNTGTVEYEQNFDPWGRRRNATDWTYNSIATAPIWLYRGFTGHEHLLQFNLINMNGRLYDPIVGRMLSPDNNIQMPDNTQNYNRYSYALNNPLRFTDPDGEFLFVPVLIGMAIGAATYTAIHLVTHDFSFKGWDWGAFAGAVVAGGVGGAIAPALAAAGIGGFYGGAITGAATGFAANLTTGIWHGDKFGSIITSSFKGALIGAAIGGVIGGIKAKLDGRNFSNGGKTIKIDQNVACATNVPEGLTSIDGKYVGKYNGTNVFETSQLGTGLGSGGVTLPGTGIFVGKGVFSQGLDPDLLMHEFGHILQANDIGKANFYGKVAPSSLWSANKHGQDGWNHMAHWTESWANFKSVNYFGSSFIDINQYIIKDISASRYLWLTFPKFIFPFR